MYYFVQSFTIKSGILGIDREKMDQQLASKLNEIASQGYDIVSVIEVGDDSRHFNYQIIFRK